MPHHLNTTAASRGWEQPASAVQKAAKPRIFRDSQHWHGIGRAPLLDLGPCAGEVDEETGSADAVLGQRFDDVWQKCPSFRRDCERRGLETWFRERWTAEHKDHERCKGFISDLHRRGAFEPIADASGRCTSARGLRVRRDEHQYERRAPDTARDGKGDRLQAQHIKRYEATLDARRSRDAGAKALSNLHRQELSRDGQPLVGQLLAGAYERSEAKRKKAPTEIDHTRRNKEQVRWPLKCFSGGAAWLNADLQRTSARKSWVRSSSAGAPVRREEFAAASKRSVDLKRKPRREPVNVAYAVSPPRERVAT
eukprot:TRINITY_DN40463_c0_g1_i1.p1 TRINITY_DN40463_c0_g1~~TRINITY_DN40463_c0_g1_i1.p1  ORF type:complete len:310 (+),score=46.20 TRINITY_DN40463_c0_g1_i1:61-990(+)